MICPPGVKPPQDPMPPVFVQPHKEEKNPAVPVDDAEPDEYSELL